MYFYEFLLIVFLIYIFVIFFLGRLIIPHMGFRKDSLPEKIPKEMEEEIQRLAKGCHSKHDFLLKAYNFVTQKYFGAHLKTFACFDILFRDLKWIWQRKGFLHCTQQNYILRIFLVKSGFFLEEEVKARCTFYWFDIHQYLNVDTGKKFVDVDPWAHFLGKELGEHAGI